MDNDLSLIPESHRAALETALGKIFSQAAVEKIERLAGGLSGSGVYKMLIGGQAYVLKLDTPSERQHQGLVCASEGGIAPKLYHLDPAAGITITGYVENQPARVVLGPERLVSELAQTIRSIHALPCSVLGHSLKQVVGGIVGDFLQTRMLSGPVVDECLAYYASITEKYPWDDPDRVFSHNDINPGNLVCDGARLWIIDWDGAFLNDRYVDLATAANFFVQTEQQEAELLRIYFDGAVDEYKRARFYVMRQISRIIYSLLMFQTAVRSKPRDVQVDQMMEGITLKVFGELMAAGKLPMGTYEWLLVYGKAQMNEAVRCMRLPRFADSLGRL
ncbi:MAG: phosphotransferase [Bacteroidetes bacterium]|nr:phosphotransferase [Bacteroidota bacterium]